MPSAFVPSVLRYQSATICTPSGFGDGIRSRIVLSRISFVSASFAVASSYARFIDICDATISVEWIEHEIETIVLPFLTSSSASARVATSPRVGKLCRYLAIFFEILNIRRRRDERDDQRVAVRCLPISLTSDAVASLVEIREIFRDLFPVGDGLVVGRVKSKHRLRATATCAESSAAARKRNIPQRRKDVETRSLKRDFGV